MRTLHQDFLETFSMAGRKDKVKKHQEQRAQAQFDATQNTAQPITEQSSLVNNDRYNPVPEVKSTSSPWEDMLAERRKTLVKEKTDAAKMQKYHALSDVFTTLGKMGGAAIGGAIGGDVFQGVNAVEYQPSRGYLDAFEKAKSANEALRRLDDQEFQLAYSKQQRDEERAYNEKQRAEDRAYQSEQAQITREFNAKQTELNRNWQAEQQRITREWQKAVADQDFARQAALNKELAESEQKFKLEYQRINNEHETAIKNLSLEIVKLQNTDTVPIGFKNGTGITIPKSYYDGMLRFFIDEEKGIDKNNVAAYIKNNPDKVNAYLKMFGLVGGTMTPASAASGTVVQYPFPYHISQIPADQMTMAPTLTTVPESTTEHAQNDTEIDYSQYKQQK